MVEIYITAPFSYTFQGRVRWVSGGETLNFDISRLEHRLHLNLLLNDNFAFRRFIQADPRIKQMLDSGVYDKNVEIKKENIVESPVSFLTPPQLPEDLFSPKYEKVLPQTSNTVEILQPLEVLETLPEEPKVEKESVSIPSYNVKEEIEARFFELDSAHYTKIKGYIEEIGKEYVTKQEAIVVLLSKEFSQTTSFIQSIVDGIKK